MTSNSENLPDEYHHTIPRFILKKFRIQSTSQNSNLKRIWPTAKNLLKRAFGIDTSKDGIIFYYDLAQGNLIEQPLSQSYGKHNLYRDTRNTDVNHLEKKLAKLESKAAQVIRSIHTNLQSGDFTISRTKLSTLRKFIFLMHYRHDSLSSTYFQEDDTKNEGLAGWIRKYKVEHQASTEDIWRDGLKYYLENSHEDIVIAAGRIRAQYGADRFHEMLKGEVDPELQEQFFALEYEREASHFCLGVWKAADDAEFLLSGNGFGLLEGYMLTSQSGHCTPGAYKLNVINPKFAIVLRRLTTLHNSPSTLESSLTDITFDSPEMRHADIQVPQERKDKFKFPMTKLSAEQTYLVNKVVLQDAESDIHRARSVTFRSPDAMVKTVKTYIESDNTLVGGKESVFVGLLRDLLKIPPNSVIFPPSTNSSIVSFNTEASCN